MILGGTRRQAVAGAEGGGGGREGKGGIGEDEGERWGYEEVEDDGGRGGGRRPEKMEGWGRRRWVKGGWGLRKLATLWGLGAEEEKRGGFGGAKEEGSKDMGKLSFLISLMIISSLSLAIFPTAGYASKTDPLHTEVDDDDQSWFHNLCHGYRKLAKIHFYVQDLLKGDNQTVHEVARANITSNSATSFGSVRVLDNPMTAGPDINSEPVGRFQGLVTSADLQILSFAMNINFVFTSGRFSGSSISISE
ncbi:UNVERIFIED_CONTAM: Dirigent protein 15 [Sesamum calycinum]|uniref:Dirigent protein n=1 Tax=Sesamum calycinum TaxID=2727403 RepID=A0AAW2PNA3_9LAMI